MTCSPHGVAVRFMRSFITVTVTLNIIFVYHGIFLQETHSASRSILNVIFHIY